MNELPKVTMEHVVKEANFLADVVVSGGVTQWLDSELANLEASNSILYNYIIERCQKFAGAAMMAPNPQTISISFAIEYILLLRIVGLSFEDSSKMAEFSNMMDKLLKGEDIKGLDDINK